MTIVVNPKLITTMRRIDKHFPLIHLVKTSAARKEKKTANDITLAISSIRGKSFA